jgi:hypothetical protein
VLSRWREELERISGQGYVLDSTDTAVGKGVRVRFLLINPASSERGDEKRPLPANRFNGFQKASVHPGETVKTVQAWGDPARSASPL